MNMNNISKVLRTTIPNTVSLSKNETNVSSFKQSLPINKFKTKVHEIPKKCEPYDEWQIRSFPSCNTMHEIDFSTSIRNDEKRNHPFSLTFQNQGGGHDVWKLTSNDNLSPSSFNKEFVLKTLRWKREYNKKEYEGTRIDSLAMERLHASKRVMNIHGYCSFVVMTEYANGRTFSNYFKASKIEKTPSEKLNYAIDIAKAIIDVHSIHCNHHNTTRQCNNITILHNDIDPSNFMISNNQLKINDFNMGRFSYYNKAQNEQCTFQNGFKCGENGQRVDFKSPEECNDDKIQYNEKIDTYSLGSVFYYILTDGVRPYQGEDMLIDDDEKRRRIVNGIYPTLPDYVRDSNVTEIVAIKNAWFLCREVDPGKRPTVNDIVEYLTSFIDKNG